jgi:hypothetical protein
LPCRGISYSIIYIHTKRYWNPLPKGRISWQASIQIHRFRNSLAWPGATSLQGMRGTVQVQLISGT